VASIALASALTGSPLDVATGVTLLVFGVVCFALLAFFVRGAARRQHPPPPGGRLTKRNV
jgi:hypothetical protein